MNSSISFSSPSVSEQRWAGVVHFLSLVGGLLTGALLGVGMLLGPLVGMALAKKKYPFLHRHAMEALNFNLTVFLCAIGGTLLVQWVRWGLGHQSSAMDQATLTLAVLMFGVALSVFWAVYTLVAAVKAWKGKTFSHPLTWRMVRSSATTPLNERDNLPSKPRLQIHE